MKVLRISTFLAELAQETQREFFSIAFYNFLHAHRKKWCELSDINSLFLMVFVVVPKEVLFFHFIARTDTAWNGLAIMMDGMMANFWQLIANLAEDRMWI